MIYPTISISRPFGWQLTTYTVEPFTSTYIETVSGSTFTSVETQLPETKTLGISEDGFGQGDVLVPILASVAPSVTSLDRSIETRLYSDLNALYESYYSTPVSEDLVFEAGLASALHTSYVGDVLDSIYVNPSSGLNYISTAFPSLFSEAQAAISAVAKQDAAYQSAQRSLVLSDLALVNTTGVLPSMTSATSVSNAKPTANAGVTHVLNFSSAAIILLVAFVIMA